MTRIVASCLPWIHSPHLAQAQLLQFHSYRAEELEKIAWSRVQAFNLFHPDAVKLAARRVASRGGDVRVMLAILRRACHDLGSEAASAGPEARGTG